MKACLEAYRFETVADIRKNYLWPMPIFKDAVSQTIEIIRSFLKNQVLLLFAIISGPLGNRKIYNARSDCKRRGLELLNFYWRAV